MDAEIKTLLKQVSAVAANAGFAGISVNLDNAVRAGVASPATWRDAMHVAREELRKDLIDRLAEVEAAFTDVAADGPRDGGGPVAPR